MLSVRFLLSRVQHPDDSKLFSILPMHCRSLSMTDDGGIVFVSRKDSKFGYIFI